MAIALKNRVEVPLSEFNHALSSLRDRRKLHHNGGLTFENGVLSVQMDDAMVTMRATGEWHGVALFSGQVLAALVKVPPRQDPIVIEYDAGRIAIGSLSVPCELQNVSARFIGRLEDPSILDLLALERSMPAAEIHRSGLWRRISRARATVATSTKKAASYLEKFEISETELRDMVEKRIRARLDKMA